jgi:spore coat polysaccharide biosynthesis protein SpsF (cytidylyltransferase family)
MSTLAVVQARMSSTRLPGKVLADVAGEPMLALLLHRLAAAPSVDEVVVATSDDPGDDAVAALAKTVGVRAHRGAMEDVLGRIAGAIGDHDGVVVRITGDCPLVDPAIVDEVVALLDAPECRYASNVEPRTYPDGLDVEALPADALRELDSTVTDAGMREHVTLAIREDPDGWGVRALVHPADLGALRWTVDTTEDLVFVRALVERLGGARHTAGLDEILDAVRREPSLAESGLRG